jgi:hypothetical protein
MRKLAFSFMVLALALLATLAINAQTKGSLSGTVTDPAGAVVPGASVTIRNNATSQVRTANTADNGVFTFTDIEPGMYTVTVENTGFKRSVANNVEVNVTTPAQVTIALEAGQVSETVTVTGAQDVVNTTSPSLTNVINTRQVTDLPLPTRNPLDLAALQAGIAVTGNDTRNASVAGLRNSATNVTQDGINAMDNFVKTSSFFAINAPSLNSVSEFSITTGTVGSEAGRGAAQVNLVTKGGSNEFHGGVFYLHRNEALNANTFFNNFSGTPKALLRQNFFGGDIGGPVYFPNLGDGGRSIFNGKDRAFFFFSYEGFRENFSVTRNRVVMTQAARQGLFSYNRTCPTNPVNPACTPGVETVNLLSVGNVGVLNPIMSGIIGTTPLPNNTLVGDGLNTAGFRFNVTGTDPSDKWVGRYDHQLVKHSSYGSHKLEIVFNRAHFLLTPDTFNSLEAPFAGGVNAFQESKRWLITGALVSNFGSSITNVFRYGKQWSPVGFLLDSQPTQPFVVMQTVADFNNTFMSQGRDTTVDEYSDNVSWVKSKHLIRFGFDYQKVFADTFNDAGINKTTNLGTPNTNPSGITQAELGPFSTSTDLGRANAVYANIVGNLSTATQTLNVTTPTSGFVPGATRSRIFKQNDVGLYVQDQWRMWSNLTVNAGVRWEFEGVPTIPNGLAIQLTNFNQVFGVSGPGNFFNPNAPAGIAPAVGVLDFVSGDTGIPLYKDDWNNFAPFLGIAWSPDFKKGFLHTIFGSPGRSSIRLGYSVSYLHDGFTVISNALGTGTTNPGLIQSAANNSPTGVLQSLNGPAITINPFKIPITDQQMFLNNSSNSVWAIDPNLKIPYVQQWNIGYEREIFPNTALEIRYVGNHAVKVWRANNINEVNIFENGFLPEFLNAQRNLAVCIANATACRAAQALGGISASSQTSNSFQNWGLTGQVALPIFDRFFFGTPAAMHSNYSNSTFTNNLTANNVGTLASSLAFSDAFRTNRNNPARGIPANFFVINPNANGATVLTNDSMSNYHALEVELRRRFSSGLQFQADYTFSKALTDAFANTGNSQADLQSFRTLRDKGLDYTRSQQDQTHRFVANALYELPFGKGRYWMSDANGFVNQIIGGWNVGTILTWATRPPWYVVSNRTTVNSFNAGNAPAQLSGMTFAEFKKNIGIFKTPAGVFFINPDLLDITLNPNGTVKTSQLKAGLITTPAPGQWGNFPINSLDGPTYFNVDVSLTKRWAVTERIRLELKTTFINILNHPSFVFGTQTFDSTNFGRITSTSGSERNIHFTGSIRF